MIHNSISIPIVLFFMYFNIGLNAQDWHSPVDHPIRLSGTFCELRNDHFHHGIDIKSSRGTVGDPIYAVNDGFIHRIRVQAAGYGKSLYIKHPKGYVSVYAHLEEYIPEFDSILYAYQIKLESFEVDLYLDSLAIPVEKGQLIGYMGSSGYSFGPHLHFEMRDAITEKTINPLHFGFEIADKIPPKFDGLRMDFLTPKGVKYGEKRIDLNSYIEGGAIKIVPSNDTIEIPEDQIGIALRVQDKMNNTPNRNGIYGVKIRRAGELVYHFRADSVGFEHTRASNVTKDLDTEKRNKERWFHGYSMPGNLIDTSLISHKRLGILRPQIRPQKVEIEVFDLLGNTATTSFVMVKRGKKMNREFPKFNYRLVYSEPNVVRGDGFELNCPDHAFYRDQFVRFETMRETTEGFASNVVSITGETTPFHQPCLLKIKADISDPELRKKCVLLACHQEEYDNYGGWIEHDSLNAYIYKCGDYVAFLDTIPPDFQVISFNNQLKQTDEIKFFAEDQFVSKGKAREVLYRAEIDGRYIPLQHDVKSNTLSFSMKRIDRGKHDFYLKLWDHAGNEKEYFKSFTIK